MKSKFNFIIIMIASLSSLLLGCELYHEYYREDHSPDGYYHDNGQRYYWHGSWHNHPHPAHCEHHRHHAHY